MIHAGKLMLGVLGSGTVLGTLLAAFADPVMKPGPEGPLGAIAGSAISADVTPARYIEPLPEDLSPPTVPNGYAPAIAYTELSDPWPVDYPMPSFEDYESENYASWSEWPEAAEPVAAEEPTVTLTSGTRTEYVQVREAASAAEEAAQDVQEAQLARAEPAPAKEAPQLGRIY